jgi:dihydroxy-acid dehydratase
VKNILTLEVSIEEIEIRRKKWEVPDLKVKRGALIKYAKNVSNASNGCVTDEI